MSEATAVAAIAPSSHIVGPSEPRTRARSSSASPAQAAG